MSKNCRIEFVEGELTCLCNHRDYRNCDLYEEDAETYDGWGDDEEEMKKPNFRYKNIEISWYKYLGRGMDIPEMTYEELDEMLNDCIKSLV